MFLFGAIGRGRAKVHSRRGIAGSVLAMEHAGRSQEGMFYMTAFKGHFPETDFHEDLKKIETWPNGWYICAIGLEDGSNRAELVISGRKSGAKPASR